MKLCKNKTGVLKGHLYFQSVTIEPVILVVKVSKQDFIQCLSVNLVSVIVL